MSAVEIVEVTDPAEIGRFLNTHWGADYIVNRGQMISARDVVGAKAVADGRCVGLVTWRIKDGALEVVSINSLEKGSGAGTALLAYAVGVARASGLVRAWLVTTNDNLDALRFYQRRSMRLCALYANALEAGRAIKPEIPDIGYFDIPMRDEIELEMVLA